MILAAVFIQQPDTIVFEEAFGKRKLTLNSDSTYSYYGGFHALVNEYPDKGIWQFKEDTINLYKVDSKVRIVNSSHRESNTMELSFDCEREVILANYMLFVKKRNEDVDYYYLEGKGLMIDSLDQIEMMSLEDRNRNLLSLDPCKVGNHLTLKFTVDSITPHPYLSFTVNKSWSRIRETKHRTIYNRIKD